MSNIEYSVITSDVIKSFDCMSNRHMNSGLDKDLKQLVFHPLPFNLMSILHPT